ncbi:hypothetical protein PP764_gp53 [Escherichia phage phi G17]|uniref:Uncharacterized protein n=1 Tax=Escherichia phage phi G17 TaxID=2234086 RepID=A0A2Z4Q1S4_9CAUD|nr:hypothetical protein PP764_gp53 [Escherichia phage phi G17]AWY03419.1 hypothetical protein [Escherichia phage phi G17]
MPFTYEVITKVILIVLSGIVLITIVKAHEEKEPLQYYGAYSAACFVLAGWIGYWIYCINS